MSEDIYTDPLDPDRRVLQIADGVIYVRELASPTPQTISEGAREVTRLTSDWKSFSILVEFPGLISPTPEVRHQVTKETLPLKEKLAHVAIVTQGNAFLKVAIRFIARTSGFSSISVHSTKEEALKYILDMGKCQTRN